MEFVYLGAILLFRVFQRISSKSCSNEMPTTTVGVSAYMSMKMAMSAAFALLLLLFSTNALAEICALSPLGWVISIATGVTLTVSTVCSLLALKGSSIVLGALFGMAGLLVPTVSGIFIYDQKVSVIQWSALVFLFLSAYLLAASSNTTNGKLSKKTVFLLLGSMLANGGTMLLQTLYKSFVPAGSVTLYSFLQFSIPALVMLVIFLGIKGKRKNCCTLNFSRKLVIFTVIAAVSLFGISQISTLASEIIPIAVLFPISDGGGMVISAIVAAVGYKEKMTLKSTLGIIIGILGICAMKLG